MSKKLKVGILCGGQSEEHQISLLSAKNIIEAIDKNKYEVTVIGIDRAGKWHHLDAQNFLREKENPSKIHFLTPDQTPSFSKDLKQQTRASFEKPTDQLARLDVVLPVLHGPNGEDGTIQGLFQLAGVPVVGCGVLSSALCMDKDMAKKVLSQAHIPVCRHLLARRSHNNNPSFERAQAELGSPLFIKPANMGSSVGVSKISNQDEYEQALQLAFQYDRKVLIEEAVEGRELEVALLGNEKPKASAVGEVIPSKDFYSFEAKYLDSEGAQLKIPADIPKDIAQEIAQTAIKAFEALECQGLARCDFFLTPENKILVNEVNTFPGFTKISQYPKLWEYSGLSYPHLIDKLIELATDSN